MTKQTTPTPSRPRNTREAGFTLLEMIVAIAIFVVVIGAMYALLEVGRSDTFNTKERTETMQNARIALNTIGRDASNAGVGYWKGGARAPDGTLQRLLFLPSETDGEDDLLTPLVPGNGVKPVVVDGATVNTDAITLVYQDDTFNNNHGVAVTARNSTTNTLTVDNSAPCASGDLYVYIIDDGNEPALGSLTSLPSATTLRFSAGDPLGLNNPGASSTFFDLDPQASCKRITWVTYFVNPEGVLVRRIYGNTARIVGAGVEDGGAGGIVPDGAGGQGVGFVEMPLAYGVEDFQIQYVMEDGTTVDDVLASVDPLTGQPIPASSNRQLVRVVRVSLRLRGSQIDPKTGQPIRVAITSSFYTPNLVVPERPGGDSA
jgi:prepilin-type N-terminal cleavage/methylation domain-containing protein